MTTQTNNSIRAYKGIVPVIAKSAYVDPAAVIIGAVALGEDSSIWPLVVIRADVNTVRVGNRSNVQDGSVIHESRKRSNNPEGYPVIIGDDVTIGHKVMLHGCTIGNRVLVGMGTIILDGAIVEDDVIIGAGSLVTSGKTLLSGYLYMGSPAQQVRALRDDEMSYFITSANNYIRLKNDYS